MWSTELFCDAQLFSEIRNFGEKADPICCRLEAPIVAMSPAEGQKGRDCWAVDYSENRNPLETFFLFLKLNVVWNNAVINCKIYQRTRKQY
jgi:hypothetical protein